MRHVKPLDPLSAATDHPHQLQGLQDLFPLLKGLKGRTSEFKSFGLSTAESLTFFLFLTLFVGQSKQAPGGSLTCRPRGRVKQTAPLTHLHKHSVVSGPPPTDLIRPKKKPCIKQTGRYFPDDAWLFHPARGCCRTQGWLWCETTRSETVAACVSSVNLQIISV